MEQKKVMPNIPYFVNNERLKIYVGIFPTLNEVEYHMHHFYEIVYVDKGYMIQYYNDIPSIVMAGDLFFVRPGDRHRYSFPKHAVIYNCLFIREMIQDNIEELSKFPFLECLFNEKISRYPRLKIDAVSKSHILKHLNNIMNENERQEIGWHIKTKNILYDFLIDASRYYMAHNMDDSIDYSIEREKYKDYMYEAIEYLNNHNELSCAKDAADILGLSYIYFYRLFKRFLGISPTEYIRNIRLAKSVDMLKDFNKSITEISLQAGYDNPAFFSKQFKETFGVSPKEFRKCNL